MVFVYHFSNRKYFFVWFYTVRAFRVRMLLSVGRLNQTNTHCIVLFLWMNLQPTRLHSSDQRRLRRHPHHESIGLATEIDQESPDYPARITPSAVAAAAAAHYQHCVDVLMKADSLHHHHHHPSDGRSPPPPSAMDHSRHHRLPQPPPPPPPSWMTAMAASTIPWPFIPQVRYFFSFNQFFFNSPPSVDAFFERK